MCGKPQPTSCLLKYIRNKAAALLQTLKLGLLNTVTGAWSFWLVFKSRSLSRVELQMFELWASFLRLQYWAIKAACCRTRALAAGRMPLGSQCRRISLQQPPGWGSSSTALKETLRKGGLSATIHSMDTSVQCTWEQSPSTLHFLLKDNCPESYLGGKGEMKSYKHLPVRLHRYCCYFCGISTYHAQQ